MGAGGCMRISFKVAYGALRCQSICGAAHQLRGARSVKARFEPRPHTKPEALEGALLDSLRA